MIGDRLQAAVVFPRLRRSCCRSESVQLSKLLEWRTPVFDLRSLKSHQEAFGSCATCRLGHPAPSFEVLGNDASSTPCMYSRTQELGQHVSSAAMRHRIGRDLARWCSECTACHSSKIQYHVRSPVCLGSVPDLAFIHLHVDLVGPFPPSASYT